MTQLQTAQTQVITPLKDLVAARLETDKRISALEKELKPLKEAKQQLNAEIIAEFKRRGEFSTRVESASVSLSVRKTAVVTDEKKVIAQLREQGLTDYITESLDEIFEDLKREMIIGDKPLLDGVQITETEFVSIRKNDKEPRKKEPRKVVVGDYKKLNQ